MTCQYRCGNACDHPVPNTSENSYFGDLLAKAVTRRGVFKAGAAGALVVGAGFGTQAAFAAVTEPATAAAGGGSLTFRPVPPNTLDAVTIPNGYKQAVVIEWGDAVLPGAPEFDINNQTPEAQAKQFGYNNDFLAVLPLNRDFTRALLVANHEYTDENLMFPGYTTPDAMTVDQIKIAMAAHGLSVVELVRVSDSGRWRVAGGRRPYNRRITTSGTKFLVTGPAAGSDLLKTAADPTGTWVIGTQNNCSGGVTPWGTILSGEENFNQYFVGADGAPEAAKPALKRYGFDITTRYPSGNRKWDRADERFDLTKHPNEANRFGWVVEVDPFDPTSTPLKHTALGRFKHEGATVILASDGRPVAYSGDDERFDYLYKFVSDRKMADGDSAAAKAHNRTLLDSGTLYVAKFGFTSANEIDGSGKLPSDGAFDGTGTWIPLVRGNESLVDGMTAAEVLVYTRLAADKVGATKMDRPEDVEPNPHTGKVYAVMTNNNRRGTSGQPPADEVNPRNANKHGHIVEITEDGNDPASETFTWDLLLVCGDPNDPSTYFAGYDKTKVSPISCPDNVAFDAYGNLWIATDGNALGSHDGLFAVPLEGPERGHLKQFLSMPVGAETCGPVVTKDNRSVFVAVQHPGEVDGASVENPKSTWPNGDYGKPAVVCAWRGDGGEIGR
jgi:secreted PhoX family phosphatase